MSGPSVPELLRRGALAPAHVTAVDAVMGEDWAHLGRGNAVRPPADEGRRTGARRAAIGGALSPNPQALVKLIGSGGTATSRGLRAQMDYLSRQGDVPLVSSESTFGTELGVADAAEIAAAWGLPDTDRGGADRTSHFVVSFPQGTDPAAAERAGRAWAAALFEGAFRRWLADDLLPREPAPSVLEAEVGAWFARERVARPGAYRLDRILRSARAAHDDAALQRVADRLHAGARERLDDALGSGWAGTLWDGAFEDFLTRRPEGENPVEAWLWRELDIEHLRG